MQIKPFATEAFFNLYEFTTPYLLCASDCESLSIGELLALTGEPPDSLLDLRLGYTESPGHPELRAAISRLYDQVDPEEVVALGAPEEGIYLTMRMLLELGDHVVVLTPAYDSLINLAEHVSGNVSRWAIRPRPDGWSLDLDELERLVTDDTRLMVVNFPHNPTGYLPSAAEFNGIIDIARRRGTWLLCDEMYRGLERNPAERLPSATDRYERAIVLAGLSKTYGLPGLRTGWLILHDPATRAAFINWKHYTTICAAAPSEMLATIALRAHEALAARNRRIIASNLEAAAAGRFCRPRRAGRVLGH